MPKSVQIHIPQLCHENWQQMTLNEQGRFCNSCQKTVVDFSAMSDKELLTYISNVAGYTGCGRFSTDQLNREIKVTENKRRFSWAYVWNVLLTTFLITEANAQVCPPKKKAIVPSVINKPDTFNTAVSTIGYKAQTIDNKDSIVSKPIAIYPLTSLQIRVGGYVSIRRRPWISRVVSRLLR